MKKVNKSMIKRLTGILLCALLVMSAMPAFAAPEEKTAVEEAVSVSVDKENAAEAQAGEKTEAPIALNSSRFCAVVLMIIK